MTGLVYCFGGNTFALVRASRSMTRVQSMPQKKQSEQTVWGRATLCGKVRNVFSNQISGAMQGQAGYWKQSWPHSVESKWAKGVCVITDKDIRRSLGSTMGRCEHKNAERSQRQGGVDAQEQMRNKLEEEVPRDIRQRAANEVPADNERGRCVMQVKAPSQ